VTSLGCVPQNWDPNWAPKPTDYSVLGHLKKKGFILTPFLLDKNWREKKKGTEIPSVGSVS